MAAANRLPALPGDAEDDEELTDIFDAFDATVTFDKLNRRLELAATVTAEFPS